jgi:organic radical activating enzyme
MLSKEIQLEVNKGAMLFLMEEFYTIQGEGYHTGTAAYFIRIGGCDVGCHWCDKESWNAELHPPTGIELIVSNASKYSETVVVTGGEPLMGYDFVDAKLKENNRKVHITSGAYPLTGTWD